MTLFKYASLTALSVSSSAIITYTYVFWMPKPAVASLFFIVPTLIGFWLNKGETYYDSMMVHVLNLGKDIVLAYIISAITTLIVVSVY